jgi:hypothetical protein
VRPVAKRSRYREILLWSAVLSSAPVGIPIKLGQGKKRNKGLVMKRLMFAIGALALGLSAVAPAHADYAIVKFKSGYCRIYDNTAWAPPDGRFVWFVWGYHRYYRLPTLGVAQHKLHVVVARHLCWHM